MANYGASYEDWRQYSSPNKDDKNGSAVLAWLADKFVDKKPPGPAIEGAIEPKGLGQGLQLPSQMGINPNTSGLGLGLPASQIQQFGSQQLSPTYSPPPTYPLIPPNQPSHWGNFVFPGSQSGNDSLVGRNLQQNSSVSQQQYVSPQSSIPMGDLGYGSTAKASSGGGGSMDSMASLSSLASMFA